METIEFKPKVYGLVIQGCRWYIIMAAQLTYELIESWTPEEYIHYMVNGLNLYSPNSRKNRSDFR